MEASSSHVHLVSFFGLFGSFIYKLVNNVAAVKFATEQTLKDFEADGVVHFEVRTTPRAFEATSGSYKSAVIAPFSKC